MKNTNYKKRKRNGIITTIIITAMALLIDALYVILATSEITTSIKIPLIFLASFLLVIVLPGLLFRLQFIIYDYLNKNIDLIETHLSSEFKEIYLKNTNCLKKSAIPNHEQRIYKAKLEDDGTIILKIENEYNKNDVLEEKVTDYSWFLSMFSLEM